MPFRFIQIAVYRLIVFIFVSRFPPKWLGLSTAYELTHEEGGRLTTFIDKLNWFENMWAIASICEWLKLREMHNQFFHNYPDDPEIQAALLNKSSVMAKQLLAALDLFLLFSKKYS